MGETEEFFDSLFETDTQHVEHKDRKKNRCLLTRIDGFNMNKQHIDEQDYRANYVNKRPCHL